MKTCISCGLQKSEADFRKRLYANNTCRDCEKKYKKIKRLENLEEERRKGREREKIRREENPEHVRNVSRLWRENNKDRVSENKRNWNKKNPEKVSEMNRKKYSKNPLEYIKRALDWAKKKPDKKRAQIDNRKARKYYNGGTYTSNEWEELKRKYDYRCLCCNKREPEIKLTFDHVVPISKGGVNTIENAQPLCLSCNSRKKDKHIDYRGKHV